MVEPYESRRQKKPTGAVRPNAAVTPYLGGNTFPLPFSGSVGTPSNYYGMTGRTHPTALGIYPADVATQSAVRTMESSTRVPDKRFPGRWNVPARPGPGGAMPLSAQAEPYTKATTSNPTVLPFQIQTPRPSFLRPTSPWNYVQSPVARPAPQPPPPASVPIDLTSYRPGVASAAPPQPWQVPAPSARTPQSPVQAAAPRPAVYPMYPGSSEWDTAPGWLARAGGVNTSTPEGRMFSAMNRPSVPVAKPAAPTGPSPWDIGTAAMNLGSPQLVKPYESAADRHAQAAAQVRRMPPGGYLAAQLAALAGNLSTGPDVSVPMSPEIAAAIAMRQYQEARNENLRQGLEYMRQNAPDFGTVAAGRSESTPGVTQAMPWNQWVDLGKAQYENIATGRGMPESPVLPWRGKSGLERPNQAKTLNRKAPETAKIIKERSIAGRAKRNEGLLPEGSRRAMVTAKAQGRRISPVQAGIEAALTAGRALTEDQLRAMYGPVFDEIRGKTLASIAAAMGTAMSQGDAVPTPPNYRDVMNAFFPLIPGSGQTSVLPWMQGGQDNSPRGMAVAPFAHDRTATDAFDTLVSDGDYDGAFKFAIGRGSNTERVKEYLELMGLKPTRSLPKAVADTVNELNSPANIDYGMLIGG